MKTLALELSSARGSLAWSDGTAEPFVREFPNDRKHSGLFFENLQLCLQRFGAPDRIVVGLGPGSYAGTRIAIATATGLQATNDAELIGFPSLAALETEAEQYDVIGDARRQSFFYAHVSGRRCVSGPLLCTQEELGERLASVRYPVFSMETLVAFPHAVVAYPSALVLAQMVATHADSGMHAPLEPIYLREPHITQPKIAHAILHATK
jgi:tRNA threonylcarbamoyl adenosine modification protein YeaZ